VVTAFDDYRPVATVPIKVATEAAIAVAVSELGACAAKFIAITEFATFMKSVAANTNADPKILRAG
jgi:hypothetical protein